MNDRTIMLLLLFLFIQCCLSALPREELVRRAQDSPNNIIDVTHKELYRVFDRYGDRNYDMAVEFTAVENPKCVLCKEMDPIFEQVASTVGRKEPQANVFFLRVDAKDNAKILKRFGIRSVPHLWVYPPFEKIYKTSSDPYDTRMPFPRPLNLTCEHYAFSIPQGAPAEDLLLLFAKFISKSCHVNVDIDKNFDTWSIVKSFIAFSLVFRLIRKRWHSIRDSLSDKNMYLCICILLIYLNLSGLNFCMQNSVPFVTQTKTGQTQWMAPSVQYQEGFEMVISIGFQVVFSALLIALIVVPQYFTGPDTFLLCLTVGLMLFLLYNGFTTAFLTKDKGYPFDLLKMISKRMQ